MKRLILTAICLLIFLSASSQEKKRLRGFDGGMMVHTGYLQGDLDAIDYTAKGAPLDRKCIEIKIDMDNKSENKKR